MRSALSLFLSCLLLSTFALAQSNTISIQLIGINDFHGNLEPPAGSSGRVGGVDAGGIEYLSTHIRKLRENNPNTLVVAAGDLIGATPLISALFHDEPAIEAMNLIGLDYSSVGNHEFDDGWQELVRMQMGGCHMQSGCQGTPSFSGANFRYLAANVLSQDKQTTLFPSYAIREIAGVKIGIVGAVTTEAPSIIKSSSIAGLSFLDEADSVNLLIPELKAQGVETIVVLIHEGGMQSGGYNDCNRLSGPIVDIANRLDPNVDVVISGHTHQAYNCVLNNKIVTSAASYGRMLSDIDLTIDARSGDVVTAQSRNLIVTRDVERDPSQTALIEKYKSISAPIANRIVGTTSGNFTRSTNSSGESSLGKLIADAQLHVASLDLASGAQIAFMNSGGIRADIIYASSPEREGDGKVTFGEVFTAQPFGNVLETMTLTGAEIHELLEQQFAGCGGQTTGSILQVSKGFSYSWRKSGGPCAKIDPSTITLNNVVIQPAREYRVVANSFLANGGDQFASFTKGRDRVIGPDDAEALESYLSSHASVSPDNTPRIFFTP